MPRILVVAILALWLIPELHAQGLPAEAPGAKVGVDLIGLIDTYYRGRRDEAIAKAAALPDLGPLRLRFVQDTPVWINAVPVQRDARSAAVAAFLLELTAARIDSDWGRLEDLIEFTCAQLRSVGPPTEFERSWHAASHALAGRARARLWLLGEYARLPHQKPINAPPPKDQPVSPRHLTHALERFPDDTRFQLTRVVAWTWGRDAEPVRNVRHRDQDDERRRPVRVPQQMEALVTLEPLTADRIVGAEAWIRIGLIHFSVGDHASALRAFESAQPLAIETSMQYLAHFNAARALEQLSRPDDAIREYRKALEINPDAESATVALASLEFSRDDRDDAVLLIDRVFNRRPLPPDPGRLMGYGSFVQWPALKAAMRAALPAYSAVPK